MAVFGVYHPNGKRGPAVLSGNRGTIFGQDLYGGKKTSYLFGKRRAVNRHFFSIMLDILRCVFVEFFDRNCYDNVISDMKGQLSTFERGRRWKLLL